jgi:hypothetical protein
LLVAVQLCEQLDMRDSEDEWIICCCFHIYIISSSPTYLKIVIHRFIHRVWITDPVAVDNFSRAPGAPPAAGLSKNRKNRRPRPTRGASRDGGRGVGLKTMTVAEETFTHRRRGCYRGGQISATPVPRLAE